MEIRKYREADREGVLGLWEEVFPDRRPHNEPGKALDAKLRVDDWVFVAVENETVIGAAMAGYDGHRGWIYLVGVKEDYRRMGVGSHLIRGIVEALRATGCVKVNLQVRASNAAVVPFYESLGFQVENNISMGLLVEPKSP